jgi:hypothetical protein
MMAGSDPCLFLSVEIMYFDLHICRIAISGTLPHPFTDPLVFFRLRVLHQAALLAVSSCDGTDLCTEPFSCPYHVAFSQKLPVDSDLLRRHQKPPHPFSWQVPPVGTMKAGSVFGCTITLIGQAAGHVVAQLQAVQRMFHAPALLAIRIESVAIVGLAGETVTLPWPLLSPVSELPLVTWGDCMRETGEPSDVLMLEFRSPYRQLVAGRQSNKFDPSIFLRQLVRRCSALAECYGEELLDIDYRELAEKSRQIAVLDQDLQLQLGGTPLAGLVGRVTLAGDLRDFWPWLVLGQWVNAGKGATFGLGHYVMA